MTEDYWDGALWVYHSHVTHQAGEGAGTIRWTTVPGAGNEMEILYGEIRNDDTVARTAKVVIDDGNAAQVLATLVEVGCDAAQNQGFPVSDAPSAGGTQVSAGARFIIAGTMRIVAEVAAVADSQDASFGIVCRLRGGVPTVTEEAVGVIVIDELTEQVF